MFDFGGIFEGLSNLGTTAYWAAFGAGLLMAAVAGVLPGVSSVLLMALAVPFVVFTIQDPVIGIVLLATITGLEEMLDVLPIVAMGHPGGGQVTFIEARPLTRQGYASRVLGFIYAVSAMGGLIGAVALLLIIPVIKPFILQFSFAEIAAVGLFGVAMVGALSRGAMVKGFVAGALGMLLSTVGIHLGTGVERYTLGTLELRFGLPLIATTVGLFALPELVDLTMTRQALSTSAARMSTREVFSGAGMALKRWPIILRHSLLGVFLGAIPGIGARVVSWLSYGIGIALSKDKNQFGKGSYDGLIFSESVQSAKEGGQAIPTLALGLPGGQSWIFVIVAMLAYGLSPGPQMLTQHSDIITLIVVSLVLGNAGLALVGMLWSGQLSKLTRVPYPLLGSVILPLAFLSAFQETTHWTAIPIVLVFATLGMAMKQLRWPRPPLILGFILGGIIEPNLVTAIAIDGPLGMLQRPLTIFLLLLTAFTAIFFTKLAAKAEAPSVAVTPDEPSVPPTIAGAAPDTGDTLSAAPRSAWSFRWSWEYLFPVFFVAVGLMFLIPALDYPTRAKFMPVLLCSTIIGLSLLQLVMQIRGGKSGEVLDLGMLSAGIEGRSRTALQLFGLFVFFILLSITFGLQWAAVGFAAAAPAFLMPGDRPWRWGLLTGGILAVVVVGLFNNLLFILWPDPLIWAWIRDSVLGLS